MKIAFHRIMFCVLEIQKSPKASAEETNTTCFLVNVRDKGTDLPNNVIARTCPQSLHRNWRGGAIILRSPSICTISNLFRDGCRGASAPPPASPWATPWSDRHSPALFHSYGASRRRYGKSRLSTRQHAWHSAYFSNWSQHSPKCELLPYSLLPK